MIRLLVPQRVVRGYRDGSIRQLRLVMRPQPLPDADIGQFMFVGNFCIRDENFVLGEDLGGVDCFYSNYRYSPIQPGQDFWLPETWGNYGVDYPNSPTWYYLYRSDYSADATGYWFEPEKIIWCDFPRDWREELRCGFEECMRVLRPHGTLIFKWSEYQIPTRDVIAAIGYKPLFGHPSGRASKTHWMTFMKLPDGER
jgi:hypothetical protein